MPLFNASNPSGQETKAALGLADVLKTLSVFHELAEATDDAAAARHVTVGRFDKPADGVDFDIRELAELGFQVRINRVDGERQTTVDGYGQTSSAGTLRLLFRRFVRDTEDEQDAYLFFWDRLDKLQDDLASALSTSNCPRLQQGAIVSESGPYFGLHAEEAAQGRYLHAAWVLPWGDAVSGEG